MHTQRFLSSSPRLQFIFTHFQTDSIQMNLKTNAAYEGKYHHGSLDNYQIEIEEYQALPSKFSVGILLE